MSAGHDHPDLDTTAELALKAEHDNDVRDINEAVRVLEMACHDRAKDLSSGEFAAGVGAMILMSTAVSLVCNSGHICMLVRSLKAAATMEHLVNAFMDKFNITVPIKSSIDLMGVNAGEES